MNEHADDERLLEIAAAISDGREVDWPALEASLGPEAGAMLGELKILSAISSHTLAPFEGWEGLDIGEVIGEGSFGTVYQAFDRQLHREVAVKVIDAARGVSFDPERAVSEARLLAKVRHPNMVVVFGAERRDLAVAVTMELIKGETLHQIVERQGPLSASEAGLIGLDVCRAVAAVHHAGLLHGDVKAQNVMREDGGRIVLMDLGTGRSLTAPIGIGGDVAGTPLYLAPEVFDGAPRTEASDIYSIGVLLFYLVTGQYPVDGSTMTRVQSGHTLPGGRRHLVDLRPDLPEPFVRVVERAMSPAPADRFRSAGELESALGATLVAARRPAPRRRTLLPAATVAVVLVVAVAGGLTLAARRRQAAVVAPSAPPVPLTTTPAAAQPYRVEASMHRREGASEHRLLPGERLAPGDRLFLRVNASVPVYMYVVNEDDAGSSNLLFPLPGSSKEPLPASLNTLPGFQGSEEIFWRVTTPGKKEYFVLFASPEPLTDVEQIVSAMPPPRFDAAVQTHLPLTPDLMRGLRSVGGLVSGGTSTIRLSEQYKTPLADQAENVTGVWIRQIVFDNSAR